MKLKFETPNKNNVELGDLLVADDPFNSSILIPVVELDDRRVIARGKVMTVLRPYEEAVILKQDGRYLVGEMATEEGRFIKETERLAAQHGIKLGGTPYDAESREHLRYLFFTD